jgi:hypothetical protein
MAEYYQIKIGSIYLTVDGNIQSAGIGSRCRLSVDGIPQLQSNYLKNRFNDMRGNPIIQKTEVGTTGREIVVTIDGKLPAAVAASIIALHQSSEANDTAIRLTGDDTDTPSFDLFVLPDKDAFTWKDPDGFGNYVGAILRYVAVGDIFLFWDGDRLLWDGDVLKWS